MFSCDKCGECCRHLNQSPLYHELHDGNGVCRYLDGNLCSIYEDRPLLCRVEEAYGVYFQSVMRYEDYIQINCHYCEELKQMRRK